MKHGESGSKLHNVWKGMRKRCLSPSSHNYYLYGARGIKICKEWDEFLDFKQWAINSGYKEGLSIEREENDGNYGPPNCRWATPKEQSNNTRTNHPITYNGVTKNVTEWAREKGMTDSTLFLRIKKGWDIEKIINTPVLKATTYEYNGEKLTVSQLCKKYNINKVTFRQRLKHNWTLEKILTTPPRILNGK